MSVMKFKKLKRSSGSACSLSEPEKDGQHQITRHAFTATENSLEGEDIFIHPPTSLMLPPPRTWLQPRLASTEKQANLWQNKACETHESKQIQTTMVLLAHCLQKKVKYFWDAKIGGFRSGCQIPARPNWQSMGLAIAAV